MKRKALKVALPHTLPIWIFIFRNFLWVPDEK